MYIQRNRSKGKNGKNYTSTFICSKYRENGKVKTKVLVNLSALPEYLILGIENMLKSEKEVMVQAKDIQVSSSYDYGFFFTLLSLMNQLRINEVLDKNLPVETACMVKAMIIGKIMTGGSKLCIYNWLQRESPCCDALGVQAKTLKVDKLYSSLGRLPTYQQKIEKKWNRYHKNGTRRVYLYDITSTYFEGTQNALAAFGYNRDGKKGKMQICIGLITDGKGFPLKIDVFQGNTVDSSTVCDQIKYLKKELGVEELIFVGDRGMQIMYHIEEDEELKESGLEFITGLTRNQIEELLEKAVIELNLFNKDLAEVTDGDKRYVLSVNPALEASELSYYKHKKERVDSLLAFIEASWEKRKKKNQANAHALKNGEAKNKKLKTEFNTKDIDNYKKRVNRVLEENKMTKYYTVQAIDNDVLNIEFEQGKFSHAENLCGKYVVCTNVKGDTLDKEQVREQYKCLQLVEHAFRDLKSDNISIRPVFHRNARQTKGHVLVCFFAYAIIKEMENKLFPFLIEYNKENKTKLSFQDLTKEINNVKICELQIGRGVKSLTYPDLKPLQEKVFQLLNINPKDMIK
jgi:transposase